MSTPARRPPPIDHLDVLDAGRLETVAGAGVPSRIADAITIADTVDAKFVREQAQFTRLRWIDPDGFNYHDPESWREFDARIR